ncbi:MAG: E3 binding domain-containing protein, partial [Spirochaetaceae bacterium]|nr:E3 binding domain-containing protein [Spirochaetaceae bacterium]
MAVEIKLPVLGEGVDSGTVAGVLAAVGDSVEADAPLIELETDKAVIEVPATEAGVIASLSVHAGDTVAVGQVIATIEPGSEPAGPSSAPAGEAAAEPPASVPPAGATAPQTPVSAAPGPPVAPAPSAHAQAAHSQADEFNLPEWPIPATPNTRRFARELGVDITSVQGTGNGGRILSGDVVRTARSLLESAAAGGGGAPVPPQVPDFRRRGEGGRGAVSGGRPAR